MKNSKKLRVIIFLGPPGSGKGTQSELLAEKTGLYHIETSEIIEKNFAVAKPGDFVKVEGKKYFLEDERKLRESGGLMSPPLIAFWTKNKIKEIHRREWGIIFSGSPRTLFEGKEVLPLLKRLYGLGNIQLVLLSITEADSIWRNSHRRTCKLLRHPIVWMPETAGLKKCSLDGSELVRRKDDNPAIIKTRLKEYRERTLPLIKYFKREGVDVKKINGSLSPAEVFSAILKAVKLE
ncbi:MAG: nucleoside monophosphate kinase [Candidatus Nealsonbacteria bacterium]|nr:nucleoside monophosphate kinase [Candidatus Nealsonbacteria bacterium]